MSAYLSIYKRETVTILQPGEVVCKLSSLTVRSGPQTWTGLGDLWSSTPAASYSGSPAEADVNIDIHPPPAWRPSWVHGHSTKHTTRHIPGNAMCVQNFDDSEIVQFILHIAFRCVLHRCRSQEIHCWKLYYISNDRAGGIGSRT